MTGQTIVRTRRETSKHRDAFEAWYAEGRDFRKISHKLALPVRTLYDWADRYEWQERADGRDEKVRQLVESRAIKDAAKRLEERGQIGIGLRALVQRHFFQVDADGKPIPYQFESTQAALNTLKEAVALEREADGLPDFVVLALNADEGELQRKRAEILAELERRYQIRGEEDTTV